MTTPPHARRQPFLLSVSAAVSVRGDAARGNVGSRTSSTEQRMPAAFRPDPETDRNLTAALDRLARDAAAVLRRAVLDGRPLRTPEGEFSVPPGSSVDTHVSGVENRVPPYVHLGSRLVLPRAPNACDHDAFLLWPAFALEAFLGVLRSGRHPEIDAWPDTAPDPALDPATGHRPGPSVAGLFDQARTRAEAADLFDRCQPASDRPAGRPTAPTL